MPLTIQEAVIARRVLRPRYRDRHDVMTCRDVEPVAFAGTPAHWYLVGWRRLRRGTRARAIGAWSGLGAVAVAAGPLVGGYLITAASWRWIFFINVPLAAAVVGLGGRHVPESRDATATGKIDYAGAAAAVVFLTGITFAFIEAPTLGWSSPAVLTTTLIAVIGLAAFLTRERRAAAPMLPLSLFAERQFAATNAVTFIVYAALIGVTFLLPVVLQIVSGYSPLASGLAFVPLTVIMLALSARSGQRSDLRDHPLRQQRARPVRAAPVPAGLTNLPVWGRNWPCAADPGPLPVA